MTGCVVAPKLWITLKVSFDGGEKICNGVFVWNDSNFKSTVLCSFLSDGSDAGNSDFVELFMVFFIKAIKKISYC